MRAANIYISNTTMRSLRWAAKALKVECPDALAEAWLAQMLETNFPNLQSVADGFARDRSKLESEAIKKLIKST